MYGVKRRAQLRLTERSLPGAWTRDHRSHSGSLFETQNPHTEKHVLDPRRDQGRLQTPRGLCPCTRRLRAPMNARATRTSTDQDTNERPTRQNSTASELHLNTTIRQYRETKHSLVRRASCIWRRSPTDGKMVAQTPTLRKIWRPIKHEETKEKTWKKAAKNWRKGTNMEDRTILDTKLRRKSQRNRDLRQRCPLRQNVHHVLGHSWTRISGCNLCTNTHTPLCKHGGTVMDG